MLTASMKLRRRGVLARYGDAVEGLYRRAGEDALPS